MSRAFFAVTLSTAAVGTVVACGLSVTGSADEGPFDSGDQTSSSSSSSGVVPDPFDGAIPGEEGGISIPTDAAPNTACSLDGGSVATGLSCSGLCIDPNRDRQNCGACGTICEAAQACEGTCVNVATALKAFRVQTPCTGPGLAGYCNCSSSVQTSEITLEGTPGKTYVLQVRFRGIAEQKDFNGSPSAGGAVGTNANFFIQNGNPRNDDWTLLQLDIATPTARYYMNRGESGHSYSDVIDYIAPIQAAAGSKVTLRMDPVDGFQSPAKNNSGANISAPGLAPYNGEYVQLDVVSAAVVP